MFDKFRYGSGAGGGPGKQVGPAAQLTRVPQRRREERVVEASEEARVFVLGGNATTLAAINSLRPLEKGQSVGAIVTARLIPLAWTPRGVVVGDTRQDVGIPLTGIGDWIDRTFPAQDDGAFVTSIRDVEMLARIGWQAPLPERIDERSVLNLEDLPDDVIEGLMRPNRPLVQCAACRSLCVRDDFVWKEKQLCAWDHHAAVFGRRGPWREGAYDERHFAGIPACAYVATPLLEELGVEEVLDAGPVALAIAHSIVNTLIEGEPRPAYMAVKTEDGFSLLREA